MVQDFSSQHYYLLLSTILFFVLFSIATILSKINNSTYKTVLSSALILILTTQFLMKFIPAFPLKQENFAFLFGPLKHYPMKRNDIYEINKLLDTLEDLTADSNDKIYVLSSSSTLNFSMLLSAYRFLRQNNAMAKRICASMEIDKRDGFPLELLFAKYVVIAVPIQYHLRPTDERVIGIPAESILNSRNIGESFIKLPYEFLLDQNIKVYIYKKNTDLKKKDLESLSGLF
jgi:hypothetical protein